MSRSVVQFDRFVSRSVVQFDKGRWMGIWISGGSDL